MGIRHYLSAYVRISQIVSFELRVSSALFLKTNKNKKASVKSQKKERMDGWKTYAFSCDIGELSGFLCDSTRTCANCQRRVSNFWRNQPDSRKSWPYCNRYCWIRVSNGRVPSSVNEKKEGLREKNNAIKLTSVRLRKSSILRKVKLHEPQIICLSSCP